ncbi:hypothetical protein ACQPXH_21715 [Nocardia sp. CA-135953]
MSAASGPDPMMRWLSAPQAVLVDPKGHGVLERVRAMAEGG